MPRMFAARGSGKPHTMQILLTVLLPREEATVPLIRHIVKDSLLRIGAVGDCVSDIELALTEACANVLHHVKENPHGYSVNIEINDSHCEIRVADEGAGFDVDAIKPATLTAESGRGITLMKSLVDELKFESQPGKGTVVHLAKRLKLKEDSIFGKLAAAPL